MAAEKSLVIAYIFWFFLGFFGVHRFYLNRPISGIVWFFTAALCGIGWLFDLCLIPSMVNEENAKLIRQKPIITTTVTTTKTIYPSEQEPPVFIQTYPQQNIYVDSIPSAPPLPSEQSAVYISPYYDQRNATSYP